MKKLIASSCRLSKLIALAALMTLITFSTSVAQKLRPEDVIAKHLAAIGSAENQSSIQTRIIAGTVVATFTAPRPAKFNGQCIMASERAKNMIAMGFEKDGQYEEKVMFDGGKVSVGSPRPGSRGYWGDFLLTHDNIVKHGLVGGVLSDSWPLWNLSDKQKLEYRGTRKINDRTVHEIEYIPRGQSDIKIVLLFDAETFQHVRSEYTRVITAGLGSARTLGSGVQASAADASGQQRPTRYKMVEEFGDFKKEGGLSLPHSYKLGLELDTRGGTQVVDWSISLTDFAFNQSLPAATFKENAKGN